MGESEIGASGTVLRRTEHASRTRAPQHRLLFTAGSAAATGRRVRRRVGTVSSAPRRRVGSCRGRLGASARAQTRGRLGLGHRPVPSRTSLQSGRVGPVRVGSVGRIGSGRTHTWQLSGRRRPRRLMCGADGHRPLHCHRRTAAAASATPLNTLQNGLSLDWRPPRAGAAAAAMVT